MMRYCLLLAVVLGLTESSVEFTHSVLLDQYDVFTDSGTATGTTTKYYPRCKSGCSVYASIPPDSTGALKEARNVVISNVVTSTTLLDIAGRIDPTTSQLLPLEIAPSNFELSIRYTGNVVGAGPMLLYIFYNSGRSNVPFEVYEARTMNRKAATARIVTILSPEPYNVGAEASQLGNTVYSYAAGMDNALEYSPDSCVKVFELRDQASFPGFILNVQVPLLSFYFNMDTPVEMYTRMSYSTVTGFEQFLTSPGFVGCFGMQTYTSSLYSDSLEHTVSGESVTHLTIDATLNTANPVNITDITNNKEYDLAGENGSNNAQQSIVLDSKLLYITWKRAYGRSAFLLRFYSPDSNPPPPRPTTTTASSKTTTSDSAGRNAIFGTFLLLTALLYR